MGGLHEVAGGIEDIYPDFTIRRLDVPTEQVFHGLSVLFAECFLQESSDNGRFSHPAGS